jgi:putative MATE family efflux protein
MFTAQLWGRRDLPNIRRVLSLSLIFSLSASLIFFLLSTLAPELVLGIYTKDPAVIEQGSLYLRVFGAGFLFFAVTMSFGIVLRSTGDVKTPMAISVGALALNMLLSYVLIFGKLGLPALGVYGAALAALISRVLEALALLAVVYLRHRFLAVGPRDFLGLDLAFARRVFGPMLPVILNETFWSFGISAYFVVYGRMGTDSIAAMNIVSTIDNVALVLAFGIANATAIMVGNRIGAGETQRAFWFAGRSLLLAMLTGMLIGSQVLLWSPAILSLYKVSPEVIENARRVLIVVALFQWIRAYNATMVVGVLRSGGDTRFSFFLDGVIIWIVGVPSAIIGAFVLHLPVYGVYFMVMSEEFIKWLLGLRRFFSRKWIHDMAGRVEIGQEAGGDS